MRALRGLGWGFAVGIGGGIATAIASIVALCLYVVAVEGEGVGEEIAGFFLIASFYGSLVGGFVGAVVGALLGLIFGATGATKWAPGITAGLMTLAAWIIASGVYVGAGNEAERDVVFAAVASPLIALAGVIGWIAGVVFRQVMATRAATRAAPRATAPTLRQAQQAVPAELRL